jgi:hypothetical protein
MPTDLPANLKFIATALVLAGGEADLSDIYAQAARVLPTCPDYYKNEDTFHATIRHTLESYCPQSENYTPDREAFFEKVSRGRYRVVMPADREAVKQRGRSL